MRCLGSDSCKCGRPNSLPLLGAVRIIEERNFEFHHAAETSRHVLLQFPVGISSHSVCFVAQPSHEALKLGYGMEVDPFRKVERLGSLWAQGGGPSQVAPFCSQEGGQCLTVVTCIGGGFLDESLKAKGCLARHFVLPLFVGDPQGLKGSQEVAVLLAGHVGQEPGQRRFALHGRCFGHRTTKQARERVDEEVILHQVPSEHVWIEVPLAHFVHESMSHGSFPVFLRHLSHPIGEPRPIPRISHRKGCARVPFRRGLRFAFREESQRRSLEEFLLHSGRKVRGKVQLREGVQLGSGKGDGLEVDLQPHPLARWESDTTLGPKGGNVPIEGTVSTRFPFCSSFEAEGESTTPPEHSVPDGRMGRKGKGMEKQRGDAIHRREKSAHPLHLQQWARGAHARCVQRLGNLWGRKWGARITTRRGTRNAIVSVELERVISNHARIPSRLQKECRSISLL